MTWTGVPPSTGMTKSCRMPFYKAVISDLPPIGGERGRQRGHVTAGNLLDLASLNRHPINLLGPAAVGVEHQPTAIRRHIEALDLLASAGHRLRQARATAAVLREWAPTIRLRSESKSHRSAAARRQTHSPSLH